MELLTFETFMRIADKYKLIYSSKLNDKKARINFEKNKIYINPNFKEQGLTLTKMVMIHYFNFENKKDFMDDSQQKWFVENIGKKFYDIFPEEIEKYLENRNKPII